MCGAVPQASAQYRQAAHYQCLHCYSFKVTFVPIYVVWFTLPVVKHYTR